MGMGSAGQGHGMMGQGMMGYGMMGPGMMMGGMMAVRTDHSSVKAGTIHFDVPTSFEFLFLLTAASTVRR